MTLAFASCDEDHLPALQDFFRRCYSATYRLAVDEALLRWQFGGAAGLAHNVKLALRGDTVHACLGYVPVELSAAGRVFTAAWTANWMVDPDHRSLGLGPLLLKQLMAEFDAVLSLGLDRQAAEILPRMGWVDFGNLRRHVCVLDSAGAGRLTAAGRPLPQAEPVGASNGAIDLVDSLDAEGVWDAVWGQHAAGTRRTNGYLKWRYFDHPSFDYRLFVTRSATGIDGFAVFRQEAVRGVPVQMGRLMELVANEEGTATLLAGVVAYARSEGVAALDFFCSSRRFDSALHDVGFRHGEYPPGQEIPILFQPIDRRRTAIRFMGFVNKLPAAAANGDWYVTKGDGDQDRPN